MAEKLLPVDMVSMLDSDELIQEYLLQVIKDGDINELIRAFGHVAKAKGKTEMLRHELDTTHSYA